MTSLRQERKAPARRGGVPSRKRPARDFGPAAPSLRRELIVKLLELADQNLASAKIMKAAVMELLCDSAVLDVTHSVRLDMDIVRKRLDLRYRGSALLLIELLTTPGRPRGDTELASIVCLRKQSVSALRVFVHDLREGLMRAGLNDVVKNKVRCGYFIASDDARQVRSLVG